MLFNGSEVTLNKKTEFSKTANICLKCDNGMQEITTGEIEVLPKLYVDFKIYNAYLVNETFEYKTNIKMAKIELVKKQVEIDFEFLQN